MKACENNQNSAGFYKVILAHGNLIAAAEQNKVKALDNLTCKLEDARLENGELNPSKVGAIDEAIEKVAAAECNCARSMNAANKNAPVKVPATSYGPLCKGLVALSNSKKRLVAIIKRICGLLGISFAKIAKSSKTIAALNCLGKAYTSLGKCINKYGKNQKPSPLCAGRGCVSVGKWEYALASSVNDVSMCKPR